MVAVNYAALHAASWLINRINQVNVYFHAATDIITSAANSKNGWDVKFNGIPSYAVNMTDDLIRQLQHRPKASTEFINGAPNVTEGKLYEFGEGVGYRSSRCRSGFWPPGPGCPHSKTRHLVFPLAPEVDPIQRGSVPLGPIGLFVNGVAMYGFKDAFTYRNLATWERLAPEFERFDMDLCEGHADASGRYHHHHFSPCLSRQLEEDSSPDSAHAKIYGWVNDGFPLYGPHHGNKSLAISCWQKRDYSSSLTGCSDGQRSCIFNNNGDISLGTYSVPSLLMGPSTNDNLTSLSSNIIPAESGVFYQDFYFNSSCADQGGVYLNYHNGHSHDDFGFHYHITVDKELHPVFPYLIGPKFYGVVKSSDPVSMYSHQSRFQSL